MSTCPFRLKPSTFQPKMMQNATGCKVINVNFAKPSWRHNSATKWWITIDIEILMLSMNTCKSSSSTNAAYENWSYPEPRVIQVALKGSNHSSPVAHSVQSNGNTAIATISSTAIKNCTSVPESNKTASFFISVIFISRH